MNNHEELRTTKRGREFKCVRCQKWRHFDNGHSEGNECNLCWTEIERKILLFVAEANWRSEDSIVRYMLRQEGPFLNMRRIEDWLFELVEVAGKLEWFTRASEEKMGTVAYMSEPLRYKFITKRRRQKNGDRRTRRNQRAVRKLQTAS